MPARGVLLSWYIKVFKSIATARVGSPSAKVEKRDSMGLTEDECKRPRAIPQEQK